MAEIKTLMSISNGVPSSKLGQMALVETLVGQIGRG